MRAVAENEGTGGARKSKKSADRLPANFWAHSAVANPYKLQVCLTIITNLHFLCQPQIRKFLWYQLTTLERKGKSRPGQLCLKTAQKEIFSSQNRNNLKNPLFPKNLFSTNWNRSTQIRKMPHLRKLHLTENFYRSATYGFASPPSPAWENFSIMMECTP